MNRKLWRRIAASCFAAGILALLLVPVFSEEQRDLTVLGPVYGTADCRDPLIALTFDDGPKRETTSRLLDGLEKRGVEATFFLIGSQVESCEDLVLRMEKDGHQVGLHTEDHVKLTGISRKTYDQEVGENRAVLKQVLGKENYMLRPPYGATDKRLCAWSSFPLIRWSVDTRDWKDGNRQRILNLILSGAQDGAIILMHDIYDTSVDAALEGVDRLMAEGYQFVTVEQLFALRGIKPEAGHVYTCLPPASGQ